MGIMLMVKYPDGRQAGVSISQPANLIDGLPTALAQAGLRADTPYRLPGRDLANLAADVSGRRARVFAEVSRLDDNAVDLVGVIDEDGFKRVMDVSVAPRETAAKDSLGLWDTRGDPEESTNLADEFPVRSAYGEQLLALWLVQQHAWLEASRRGPVPQVEVSPERARELQSHLERWWFDVREKPEAEIVKSEMQDLRRELEAVRFASGRADHTETIVELEQRFKALVRKVR